MMQQIRGTLRPLTDLHPTGVHAPYPRGKLMPRPHLEQFVQFPQRASQTIRKAIVPTNPAIRTLAWLALAVIVAVTSAPLEARRHVVSGGHADVERAMAFLTLGGLYGASYRRYWPLALGFVVLVVVALETA